MIWVIKHDKFKRDISHSSAELIRNQKLDYLENPEQLDKEVRKGNNVYCWMSPYELEINERRYMYWDLNPLITKERYATSKEEI